MKNPKGAGPLLAWCLKGAWPLLLFLPFAFAGYDLKEITPAIQQTIQSRQSRYAQLQELKQSGAVGENNQGFVSLLNAAPGAEQLASLENQDRATIYQAIASQNQLGPSGLEEVKRIFAEVQRGKALPGELIQLPTGEWVKK